MAKTWTEISRFFGTKDKGDGPNMNLTTYLADSKFSLPIDKHSIADTSLHGNGVRLVYIKDGIHLEIEKVATGSGEVTCHVYTISDAQMNIMVKQLKDVQY